MDQTDSAYKMPAVKLFVSQLEGARQPRGTAATPLAVDQTGLVLLGLDFTRGWLQVRDRTVTGMFGSLHQGAS